MAPSNPLPVLAAAAAGLPLACAAGTLAGLPAGLVPPAAAAGAVLLAGGIALGSSRPDLEWFGPAICRGPADGAAVALTFDDGPDPASTPALLDALAEAGARATFFVLADRAARHPDLYRRIAREQEAALHGPTHSARLAFLPPERGARALLEARALLTALEPAIGPWFRPPFGVVSPRLARAVELAGLRLAWCSLRTRDGTRRDPERLVRACRQARAGDIVLLHEGAGRPAARVLPRILAELADRGLQAVSLGDLVAPPPQRDQDVPATPRPRR